MGGLHRPPRRMTHPSHPLPAPRCRASPEIQCHVKEDRGPVRSEITFPFLERRVCPDSPVLGVLCPELELSLQGAVPLHTREPLSLGPSRASAFRRFLVHFLSVWTGLQGPTPVAAVGAAAVAWSGFLPITPSLESLTSTLFVVNKRHSGSPGVWSCKLCLKVSRFITV